MILILPSGEEHRGTSEGCEQIEISVEGNVAVVKLNRPERHNALGTRIAAEDAEFGFPEVGFGIVPGAGGTQRFPRLIDPTNAKELILTARRIDAETALGMGILSRVNPKDSILGEARALAEEMVKNSPLALACAKAAIDVSTETSFEQGFRFETAAIHATLASEDYGEGLAALAEKRAPEFPPLTPRRVV